MNESNEISEYIIENDRTGIEQYETLLKNVISDWANNIPYHNIKDLGNLIQIHSIHYRPSYLLLYRTQYDNREVLEKSEYYTKQNIPTRKYYKPGDVNVWDFDLSDTSSFKDHVQHSRVQGSEHIITCFGCKGHGEITCQECGGHGEFTCQNCNGYGTYNCSNCGGTGSRNCLFCNGNGEYECSLCRGTGRLEIGGDIDIAPPDGTGRKFAYCSRCNRSGKDRCYRCKGNGTKACDSCNRGQVDCGQCDSKGTIICSCCRGNGSILCPTCEGYRKMMHYLSIQQTLRETTLNCSIHHRNISERYPKFYIDPLKTNGDVKLNETAKNLSNDIMDNTHIKNIYQEFHQEAIDNPPVGKIGNSTKIKLQNLQVIQVDVYDIEYTYDNKKYHMIVWRNDNSWNVYDLESPLSKLRDTFIETAETAFKKRRLGESQDWLDKAEALDVHRECKRLYELKAKIQKKMYRQYKWGIILGGILSGGLFGFLTLLLLQKTQFIFPFINDYFTDSMNRTYYHPLIVAGLYILYLSIFHKRVFHFVKDNYGTGIRSGIMRFVFTFLVSVFFGGLTWGMFYLANATGLTLIATGIVNLIIFILQLIIELVGLLF